MEFTRKSSNGRITLVITPCARPVQSLWAIMDLNDPNDAREALRKREGSALVADQIGLWKNEESAQSPEKIPDLAGWASQKEMDAVIWTALCPKFDDSKATPTEETIIGYLKTLSGNRRDNAEKYIRRAPRQIDTAYRRIIEAQLGWNPID